MDFYQHAGKLALGSRLRRLSQVFTGDAVKVFELYDVDLQPHWFPVFYVLSQTESLSISAIAEQTGQPHPGISQIVKAMTKARLVQSRPSPNDGRVNLVSLSPVGQQLVPKIQAQYQDVTHAVEALFGEMQHDLWQAIAEIEHLLSQKNFYTRVQEQRKQRERTAVTVVDYAPQFQEAFKQLNYAWIEEYFSVEDTDRHYLENPESTILQAGGHILIALYNGAAVGTCALIKIDDAHFELAKMAVADTARGRGIGRQLGEAAIQKARELGAQKLLIESNTVLTAAINLYYALGFKKIVGPPSPYERCNIQMELPLG